MRPANKKIKSKIIAGTATLTLAAILLSVGSAHGRLIEWASTEYIYTPVSIVQFTSDCLTPEGQMIQLNSWAADETTRTIEIAISGPESEEPPMEEPTQEPTEEPTEEPTQEPTQEPTEVPTEEVEEPTEEPTQTDPTEPAVEETTEPATEATQAQSSGASQTEATEPNVPDVTEPENAKPTEATEPVDPTDPTEPTEPVEPTDPTEPTGPDTEPTDPETEPTDPPVMPPKDQWTDGETTILLDAVAAEHLTLNAEATQTMITVTLTRPEDAPGLAQESQMTFHVQWQGLQGTFVFQMQPYGDIQPQEEITDATERQVVTGLQLFSACDVLDTKNPISVIRLNLHTFADFTLRFSCDNQPLYGVRWSMDGGKTYTMLYEASQLTVSWPYPENWNGVVCLDFGQALTTTQRPTIHVMATDYEAKEYSPVRQAAPQPAHFVMQTEQFPHLVEMSPFWGSTQLEGLRVERLTINDEGLPVYAEDDTIIATVENGGIRLTPADEKLLPACGSYRLTIFWSWYGVPLEERIVYFFVNTH